jgi:hypothetical protein
VSIPLNGLVRIMPRGLPRSDGRGLLSEWLFLGQR